MEDELNVIAHNIFSHNHGNIAMGWTKTCRPNISGKCWPIMRLQFCIGLNDGCNKYKRLSVEGLLSISRIQRETIELCLVNKLPTFYLYNFI